MKNIWYFIISTILFLAAACDDEISFVTSNCTLEEPAYSLYLHDAERLVLQRILEEQLPEKDSIQLPQVDVERVHKAMTAIYNAANSISAADLVANTYTIHTFPFQSLNSMIIGIDTTFAWTQEWANGNTLTGNSDIDDLINTYNMTLSSFSQFTGTWAVLESANSLNIYALGDAFELIDGVVYASPNGAAGDGKNIEMITYGNEITLQYSIGWGDCYAGCISRHYWEFKVTEDCEVEYLRSFGDPL